jgi:hypothetical protein
VPTVLRGVMGLVSVRIAWRSSRLPVSYKRLPIKWRFADWGFSYRLWNRVRDTPVVHILTQYIMIGTGYTSDLYYSLSMLFDSTGCDKRCWIRGG